MIRSEKDLATLRLEVTMFTNQIKEFSQLSDLLKGRNQLLMEQLRGLGEELSRTKMENDGIKQLLANKEAEFVAVAGGLGMFSL